MYKLTRNDVVVRISDGALIPDDPQNADRAAYVAWLAEGNTPQPAEQDLHAELVARARAEALPIRMKALDVLTGLAVDCKVRGEDERALLCVTARDAVKDMGALDLTSCGTDYEAMRTAYKLRWVQIVAPFVPHPDLKVQFEKALR